MTETAFEARIGRLMLPVGVIASVFWAVGTNLLDERWYPVHGINVGDVVFAGWMALALSRPRLRRTFVLAAGRVREHLALIATLVVLLLTSMAVNAFRFGAQWADILAILRLFYFSLIVVFVIEFVRRHGAWPLLCAFLVGIACLTAGRVYTALVFGGVTVLGIPVLRDPNVIGNLLGVGVFLASLGVLMGRLLLPLAFAVAFSAASVLTFSKGAWLMVAIGLASILLSVMIMYPEPRLLRSRRSLVLLVFLGGLGWIGYRNAHTLRALYDFKLQSTASFETIDYRYRFAVAGLYAMGDYPAFGVGFRNYAVTYGLYPEIMPEPSENAHNVFVQVGAVGGVPSFLVFLLLFAYPFPQLWRALPRARRRVAGALYVLTAILVFATSGSVQLQLMAQPFFWFFTGIVRVWRSADLEAPVRMASETPYRRAMTS